MFIRITTILITILLGINFLLSAPAEAKSVTPPNDSEMQKLEQINTYVKKQMKKGKIPGFALVIAMDHSIIYSNGFGYADKEHSTKVTASTLFELGSNSKAYTAAGIYLLEEKGLLRTSDPVSKYIPWLKLKYKGKYKNAAYDDYVDITLEQLLHHTSGISSQMIGYIPETTKDDALEQTVRLLLDHNLDFYPGQKFEYATLNYDVLALVIESVTKMSFERFIKDSLLVPLGLHHTYFGVEKPHLDEMATGYKMRFFRPTAYDAPIYRGNTAAGYIITDADDLGKWMLVQFRGNELANESPILNAIHKTHLPNRQVPPSIEGASYAGGWEIIQNGGGELQHGGNNPNYSSYILLRPETGLGIGVMSNINTSYIKGIALGIESILDNETVAKISSDHLADIDKMMSLVILFLLTLIGATTVALSRMMYQLLRGKRRLMHNGRKSVYKLFYFVLVLGGFMYIIYQMPNVFFEQMPWSAVSVWGPATIIPAVIMLLVVEVLFSAYILLTHFFPMEGERLYFQLTTVGLLTGLGNASVIFIINEKLNQADNRSSFDWFLYFIMAVAVYVIGSKFVQANLITLTNNVVYKKRSVLIDKLLHASYHKFEELDRGAIHTALNNDTAAISELPRMLLNGVTCLVTVLFCFIYLGAKNVFGLLLAIGVILLAAGLYRYIGQQANVFWNRNRDTQETFFGFINDLVHGMKELNLHQNKRESFRQDIMESCENNRSTNVQGSLKFVNVFVIGELLFTFVLGTIVFGFPYMFANVTNDILQNYVLVILYMVGPVHGILNFIPSIMQLQVIWKRLERFEEHISSMDAEKAHVNIGVNDAMPISIALRNVEYSYTDENGETFHLGPINFTFNQGELIFITGGNGSGKSTLAKIITGLYVPTKGEVVVNGQPVSQDMLGEYFSVIFSDYHLFDKLYGINEAAIDEKLERSMKLLQIDHKVKVTDRRFSTTKLSSGQRKRLAMLVSMLEDKPVSLFDEWAAEQDPEFRQFFYQEMLMRFKNSGKCIIAITHDDRFFSLADKILKLERGGMVAIDEFGFVAHC
ncbi:hypothetical protein A3848_01985 [Paenibacillus sp. P32E]|nr:hypothetical protein A3848_01985 [Paenibacillus sp. P32E]